MNHSDSQWVRNVKTDEFEDLVVSQSQERLVVIDFWAPWCGPCRQLGPLLEKLVNERNGQVLLVKVNTEEEPALAQAFGVQSIPMVVAARQGQFIDKFEGLLPENVLAEWIDRLLPSEAEQQLAEADRLRDDDPAGAEAIYRTILDKDADVDAAKVGLAAVCLAQGREEEAQAIIDQLERRGFLEPEAEKIKSQLELLEASEEAGGLDEARQAAAAAPDDLEKQLQLAEALAANRKYEEALEIALSVVVRDRAGHGEAAREVMVNIFNTLGAQNPLVGEYRRKLATALY